MYDYLHSSLVFNIFHSYSCSSECLPRFKKNSDLLSFLLAEINKPTATNPNPHLLPSEHSAAAVQTDTHTQIFYLLPTDVYT